MRTAAGKRTHQLKEHPKVRFCSRPEAWDRQSCVILLTATLTGPIVVVQEQWKWEG